MNHDMHDHDRSRPNGHLLMGLMAGAAVGGGLALLFAPRQGAEMRRELATSAQRAGRRLRDGCGSVSDSVRQHARHLADQAHDLRARADDDRAYGDDGSEPLRDAVDAATARRMPTGIGTPRPPVE